MAEGTLGRCLLVPWAQETLAAASAEVTRASKAASVDEAASAEALVAEEAAASVAVLTDPVAIETVMEPPAVLHPDLGLTEETAMTATVATVAIVVTVVTVATAEIVETETGTEVTGTGVIVVGMIEAAAHMTTDTAAATVMVADTEIVRAAGRVATWNPSAAEKVGIAIGTTTDPETTMVAESAATTVAATKTPGSCADTKFSVVGPLVGCRLYHFVTDPFPLFNSQICVTPRDLQKPFGSFQSLITRMAWIS